MMYLTLEIYDISFVVFLLVVQLRAPHCHNITKREQKVRACTTSLLIVELKQEEYKNPPNVIKTSNLTKNLNNTISSSKQNLQLYQEIHSPNLLYPYDIYIP